MAGEYSPAMHVHAGTHVYPNTRRTFSAASTTAKLVGALCKALPSDCLKIVAFMCVFAMLCLALLALL